MEILTNTGALIVVLGVMIFFHEFGHFITAKAFGMRVFIFNFGFGKRLLGFRWSSLPLFAGKKRPGWLEPETVLAQSGGLADTPAGWRRYVDYLGVLAEEDTARREERFGRLSRSWAIGSTEFKQQLRKELTPPAAKTRDRWALLGADREAQRQMRGVWWEEKLAEAAKALGIELTDLPAPFLAPEKVQLAALLKATTSVSNGWLADRLAMGQPATVSHYKTFGIVIPDPEDLKENQMHPETMQKLAAMSVERMQALGYKPVSASEADLLIGLSPEARLYGPLKSVNASSQADHTLDEHFDAEGTLNVNFVDIHDHGAVKEAITPKTKALYGETIGNPAADILDISAIADIAHDHGIPLIVDNTFATPYLCRPIEHGADIVVHSATKFIGGHGVVIGGVIVESGLFPFDNGNFPGLTDPSPAYHDLMFWENFREYAYLMKARVESLRDIGAAMSPFNAFILLLGLETLSLRMARHAENARKVAEFLAGHPEVAWVRFPIFDDNPWTELARKYVPEGPGAVFTFGVRGGFDAAARFIAGVELASHLANVGDAKTLVIHPASTTHQQVPIEERRAAGVGDEMIRISVGTEDVDDIIWDLGQALGGAAGEMTGGARE